MSGKVTDSTRGALRVALLEKKPKNAFKKGLLYRESSGENIGPSGDSIRSVDRRKQNEGHTARQGMIEICGAQRLQQLQSLEEFTKAAEIRKRQILQQMKSRQKLRSVSLGNIEGIRGHEDFILKAARVYKRISSMSNCADFSGFGVTLSSSENEDLLMDSLGDGGIRSSLSGKSGHEELKSISKQIIGTGSDQTRNGLQAKKFNAKPKRKVSFGNLPTLMTGDDYYDRSNKSLSSEANDVFEPILRPSSRGRSRFPSPNSIDTLRTSDLIVGSLQRPLSQDGTITSLMPESICEPVRLDHNESSLRMDEEVDQNVTRHNHSCQAVYHRTILLEEEPLIKKEGFSKYCDRTIEPFASVKKEGFSQHYDRTMEPFASLDDWRDHCRHFSVLSRRAVLNQCRNNHNNALQSQDYVYDPYDDKDFMTYESAVNSSLRQGTINKLCGLKPQSSIMDASFKIKRMVEEQIREESDRKRHERSKSFRSFPQEVFRFVRLLPGNHVCCDCRDEERDGEFHWALVSTGTLLCERCALYHMTRRGHEVSRYSSACPGFWYDIHQYSLHLRLNRRSIAKTLY
jgi:hypothetical protein